MMLIWRIFHPYSPTDFESCWSILIHDDFFMRAIIFPIMIMMLLQSVAICAEDGTIFLARDSKTEYEIVAPDQATSQEITAARELKEHLDKITGAEFAIVREGRLEGKKKFISVGRTQALAKAKPNLNLDALGHDGICLMTS
ncbi:MAG: hypothetical protein NTX50_16590, partial [Candidatus Sumerlaeota bacterium]|nr:hypothetical protein [Candidatus Sumerlaeota bacterium]